MLQQLMMKDKQWKDGGTVRVHMDAYQDYLKKNGIPLLLEQIQETLAVIVDN